MIPLLSLIHIHAAQSRVIGAAKGCRDTILMSFAQFLGWICSPCRAVGPLLSILMLLWDTQNLPWTEEQLLLRFKKGREKKKYKCPPKPQHSRPRNGVERARAHARWPARCAVRLLHPGSAHLPVQWPHGAPGKSAPAKGWCLLARHARGQLWF